MKTLGAVLALAIAASSARAQTHLVIVSGLGGEPRFTQEFEQLSESLATAASTRFAIPDSDIVWLGEDPTTHAPHFAGESTRANIEHVMNALAARARPGDQVVLVLIGHGSGEGADSKLSIPGADLTAKDFAALLARFPTQRVAFVDLSSASGDMLPVLAAPNRVVITATKSSFERNESHFGKFFIDALTKDVADTDKDGRVSLLEAFRYAVVETKRVYDDDSRLQTEHAQLDDTGAQTADANPDGRSGQGMLAGRFFLDGAFVTQAGANDPRLAGLYQDKTSLEDQIAQLEQKKASMDSTAYDDALEQLLVRLARTARTIRATEGRK